MKSRFWALVSNLVFVFSSTVYAQNQYRLPHVADGSIGGYVYRTTFILFNNSDANVATQLSLTDDSGNPLVATIGGLGTGSQFSINLDAGSTAIVQTDGASNGSVGAAAVTSSGPIGVSAVFTVYDTNGNYLAESGVGSSDLMTDFMLPVDSTGSSLTGLALFNPGADATVTMTLVNPDGSKAASEEHPLRSGSHRAAFVALAGQLFPAFTNFRGTLAVHSTSPIAALALRQYQSPSTLSYTSLPVVARSANRLTLNFPQVANGSYGSISFKTSFLIFNISSSPANVSLALTQDNGSPFTVTIPGSGPGTGMGSSFSLTLAAGASVILQTDGLGAGTSGAATLTSNVPVGASAIFTVVDSQGQFQTEAGVGDSSAMASFTLPVDITGSFDTGIAFFNPGSGSVTLTMRLLAANGVFVNSTTRPLPSQGHLAIFVDQLFPGVIDFRGSLAVSASTAVAATTLRQFSSGATYTTLPTAQGASNGQAQATPLLSRTLTGISASVGDPDVSISETLDPGLMLWGTVSGAGRLFQVIAKDSGNNFFAGQVDPLTSTYLVVVPAGTYNLTVWYQPAGSLNSAPVTMTFVDPEPVQVSAGGLRKDIILPAVTLSDVTGLVSGLGSLPPGTTTTIVFTSIDGTTQGVFVLDAAGSCRGALSPGNYIASASREPIPFMQSQAESLKLFNLGSLVVGGGPVTGNYSVPPIATLSGTVRGGLQSILPGTGVIATDTSAPQPSGLSCCALSATSQTVANSTGQYQMVLARGRSFSTGVKAPVVAGGGLIGTITYPLNSSALALSEDTTLDFAIPVLPPRATIFGVIRDSQGGAVPGVIVTAYSQSISGAPNLGFSVSAKTDSFGNYSLLVLAGSNYRLTFVPPSPKP